MVKLTKEQLSEIAALDDILSTEQDLLDTIAGIEALRDPEPCEKHPKMFWKPILDYGIHGKVDVGNGYCAICAEIKRAKRLAEAEGDNSHADV